MPHVVESFANSGFQVLSYDLIGRGYSASPDVKYSTQDYVVQLKEVLDRVGWERASLLGYSLGGGIAAAFADQHTENVHDLVLVSPAGLRESLPIGVRLLKTPVLGSLFAKTLGRRVLSKLSNNNHSRALINSPHM
ncbi:UNVERIFIED_CONTAM: hypothetical protein HDU68_011821, partial [Siphonaria sp. JEL0065]